MENQCQRMCGGGGESLSQTGSGDNTINGKPPRSRCRSIRREEKTRGPGGTQQKTGCHRNASAKDFAFLRRVRKRGESRGRYIGGEGTSGVGR